MKLAKNSAFLRDFSKSTGIFLFVLKYMLYISLLLKMTMGFPDKQKSWLVSLSKKLDKQLNLRLLTQKCPNNRPVMKCKYTVKF